MSASSRNDWGTPQALFDLLDREFHFALDVCAHERNHKCERFYTAEDNGLIQPWAPHVCWMNPPYSETGEDGKRRAVVGDWLRKARNEVKAGAVVVSLLVNDPSTEWWTKHVMRANIIRTLLGSRLQFDDAPGSPTFTNSVVVFDGSNNHIGGYWNYRTEPWPRKEIKA